MANIVNYKKGDSYSLKSTNKNVVDVNCVYETQRLYDGSKVVVIKTYNPNSINASVSQTLHFSKKSAIQLIEILKKELDI